MPYDSFVRDRLPPPELLPEFRFELPELHYPERLNAAAELLKGGTPDAPAVVNDHGRWTYAELGSFSGRIARLLVEQHGLVPGNRVLLRGPNGYTMFAAWLGVLKAGGLVVATMPLLRPGEIATVIERAQISHAIVDSRFIGDFRQAVDQTHFVKHIIKYDGDHGKGELETRTASLDPLPPADTGRDDPALIAFTSGTTGVPKGCVQFHRDILAPCDTFARHLVGPQPGDVFLTSAPMAFTFGLGITPMFPLRFGAASATLEQASPPALLDAIARFGVTHLGTAPTAYKAMLSQPKLDEALKTLSTCISAGEHLPEATWRAWHERTGIAIADGIGSTEMMHIFVSAAGEDIRPGATGKAVPGYEVSVLDPANQPMIEGVGRLAVKGPTGCRY
ncbi:MAG: AMP-binding protein, partial [Sphingomicrobium sp.]